MKKITIILVVVFMLATGNVFGQKMVAEISGPVKTSIFSEVEIDSINMHLNNKLFQWRKKRPRYILIKNLTTEKGVDKVKSFLFADSVSTKEVYTKCVFFMHFRNDPDLGILNRTEKLAFSLLLREQVDQLSDRYWDLKNFIKKAIEPQYLGYGSMSMDENLIGPTASAVFTGAELDSINKTINTTARGKKYSDRYVLLKYYIDTKGTDSIKGFLFSEDPSSKEIYTKCVFLFSMMSSDPDIESILFSSPAETIAFFNVVAAQSEHLPYKYYDISFSVKERVSSYRLR